MKKSLQQLAHDLGLDADELLRYANGDNIGGWPEAWEMGSMPENDGKILHALIRALKPSIVVEIGVWHGCSSKHILSALVANDHGKLYSYDLYADKIEWDRFSQDMLDRWIFTREDALKAAFPSHADVVFEDAYHGIDDTRQLVERALKLQPRIVLSHDGAHFLAGQEVRTGFGQAIGHEGTVISPSICGFVYKVFHYES